MEIALHVNIIFPEMCSLLGIYEIAFFFFFFFSLKRLLAKEGVLENSLRGQREIMENNETRWI